MTTLYEIPSLPSPADLDLRIKNTFVHASLALPTLTRTQSCPDPALLRRTVSVSPPQPILEESTCCDASCGASPDTPRVCRTPEPEFVTNDNTPLNVPPAHMLLCAAALAHAAAQATSQQSSNALANLAAQAMSPAVYAPTPTNSTTPADSPKPAESPKRADSPKPADLHTPSAMPTQQLGAVGQGPMMQMQPGTMMPQMQMMQQSMVQQPMMQQVPLMNMLQMQPSQPNQYGYMNVTPMNVHVMQPAQAPQVFQVPQSGAYDAGEWQRWSEGEYDYECDEQTGYRRRRRRNRRKDPVQPEAGPKVFVGGLNPMTTTESLRKYFEPFGTVLDVAILADGETKKSRGFGFVEFEGEIPDGILDREHMIEQRRCGVRRYEYAPLY